MPTYTFKNKSSGEVQEIVLRMSELDDFKSNNPELEQVITHTGSIVSDSGRLKPDDGFRDVLRSIKKASGRNNTINTF